MGSENPYAETIGYLARVMDKGEGVMNRMYKAGEGLKDFIDKENPVNKTPICVLCNHGTGETPDTIPFEQANEHPMATDTLYEDE